jgi:hypothetical protein
MDAVCTCAYNVAILSNILIFSQLLEIGKL